MTRRNTGSHRLVDLIDMYRDAHGQPSDASIARAVGVSPQTLSAWRRRGLKELPNSETLRRLSDYIGFHLDIVVEAALIDAGYKAPTGSRPVPPRGHDPHSDGNGEQTQRRRGA